MTEQTQLKAIIENAWDRRTSLDPTHLPYNDDLLSYLKKQRDAGATLVLATAAPEAWALAVSDYLGIFDRVLATDDTNGNLKGKRKLAIILKDAAGNQIPDNTQAAHLSFTVLSTGTSGGTFGSISAAALSFMVHEPSGIMLRVSDRSRDSSSLR